MGRRGPAPQPRNLKLINGVSEGRDSGGRKVPDVPRFKREAPELPDGLPPKAVEMFESTAAELEAFDLLKRADLGVLTGYALAWDQVWRGVNLYKDGRFLVQNPKTGAIKTNPAVGATRDAIRLLFAGAQQLGCTPSAEAALGGLMSDVDIDSGDTGNPFARGQ
jgi:P27 family predicted phage terminase small subunit